jgi:hypothetical protein
MNFVSVIVKRSKLRGGNLRYSILPTNPFIHWKELANGHLSRV